MKGQPGLAHCGEGSEFLLDRLAKPYLLVPRAARFQEHVDDHQVELAMALAHVPLSYLSQASAALLCRRLPASPLVGNPMRCLPPPTQPPHRHPRMRSRSSCSPAIRAAC